MHGDIAVAQDRRSIAHLLEGDRARECRVPSAIDKRHTESGKRWQVHCLAVEIEPSDQPYLACALTDENRTGEQRVGEFAYRSLDIASPAHPRDCTSERSPSHDMELLHRQLSHRDRRMAGYEGLQWRCCLLRAELGQEANDPVRLKAMLQLIDQDHRSIARDMALQSGDEQSDRA